MEKENIIVLAVVSWIFIVFALFSILIVNASGGLLKSSPTIDVEENMPCSNLNLINTVDCLRKEQGKWWEYNISNKGLYWNKFTAGLEDVDWEIIKEQGGVCSHSSLWYIEEAEKLGFTGKRIPFWGEDKIGHEIALIYSQDLSSYCILDQQATPKCTNLNPSEVVE